MDQVKLAREIWKVIFPEVLSYGVTRELLNTSIKSGADEKAVVALRRVSNDQENNIKQQIEEKLNQHLSEQRIYLKKVHAAADQVVKESMEIDGKMAVRLPVFTALQKALKGEE